MLVGAICGAIGAIIGIIFVLISKNQKYSKLLASIKDTGAQYSAPFYYASSSRYQKALKVYDSYGILYITDKTVFYKANATATPWAFNMGECRIQEEPDWRKLKWFSITTPNGEKYYFDSYKMGAFANDSNETLRALALIRSKMSATPPPPPAPPPMN
jgi:hypothetical protein